MLTDQSLGWVSITVDVSVWLLSNPSGTRYVSLSRPCCSLKKISSVGSVRFPSVTWNV